MIGSVEGLIKAVSLSYHRQHTPPRGDQRTILLASGARMEELQGAPLLQLDAEGVTLAG